MSVRDRETCLRQRIATMEGAQMNTVKTFGPVDQRSLRQLERCMETGETEFGVLCADHHPGYSQPIGGAIAYEGYVSPSGSVTTSAAETRPLAPTSRAQISTSSAV
jgi:hypothetical protein